MLKISSPPFAHHCSRPSHLAFNKIRNISVSYFLKIKFRNDNISPPNRLKMQELSEPSLNPLSVLTFTHPAPMTMLSPCLSHLVFPYLPCFHSANHCHVNRMAQSSFPLSWHAHSDSSLSTNLIIICLFRNWFLPTTWLWVFIELESNLKLNWYYCFSSLATWLIQLSLRMPCHFHSVFLSHALHSGFSTLFLLSNATNVTLFFKTQIKY